MAKTLSYWETHKRLPIESAWTSIWNYEVLRSGTRWRIAVAFYLDKDFEHWAYPISQPIIRRYWFQTGTNECDQIDRDSRKSILNQDFFSGNELGFRWSTSSWKLHILAQDFDSEYFKPTKKSSWNQNSESQPKKVQPSIKYPILVFFLMFFDLNAE